MYLSNNCVLEFFVEADYNPDFREKVENNHSILKIIQIFLIYSDQID
jgi:hypothetical protein